MSQSVHVRPFRDLLDSGGVVEDPERIATYTMDQRQLFTGSTFAVLKPATTQQVADIVRLAAHYGIGIVPQGGNTSYCGGATPDASGRQVIVSLERMDRIREIDPVSMSISVDAGAILKNVQDAAAAAGLLLPLSLGAEASCRIGGNIGTNAGGLSVVRYGMTRDLLLGIEAVLADGTVVSDMRKLRKNNTGYDVKQCFVGSEGTLGIVTGAVLRLAPLPTRRATAWLKLAKDAPIAELLTLIRRESADLLTTFEFMTSRSITLATEAITDPPSLGAGPGGAVLVEFASASRHLDLDELMEAVLAEAIETGCVDDALLAQSGSQRTAMWRLRETIPEGEKRRNGSVKHDISVPLSSIQRFLDLAGSQVRSYDADLELSVYGHVGDGNLHYNVLVPRDVDRLEFTKRIESSLSLQLYNTAAALGGTFSAEHGVGRFKKHLLDRYSDPGRIAAMRRIKTAFDPADIMNAGAIVCPMGGKSAS
ncbi:FAD-binding oxidoreductase [Bradyrhizobium sp. BRP23]|uniref:FAD/FMN-containing dehydrogenase n=1 Tax=Bradyrhizobium yuanmingense TaxID=108015 RepID=A0A1C3XAG1_9BRAD|nr:FAD-binding oxidoreductase [Bradyrhizobium sp. BRP23]TWI21988.1 FAD/FMN-containing dehydrogenase [Bradyrhizobium yuanmingense]SCB48964.1 FAD/FMN-containing dehydrogenase [Bradyrhizobium yuanmingense]